MRRSSTGFYIGVPALIEYTEPPHLSRRSFLAQLQAALGAGGGAPSEAGEGGGALAQGEDPLLVDPLAPAAGGGSPPGLLHLTLVPGGGGRVGWMGVTVPGHDPNY